MLLCHCLDDFTSFSCLANVISRPFFQCFFRPKDAFKAECLQARLDIFGAIFVTNLPGLHRHLRACRVDVEIVARSWLMTVFRMPGCLAKRGSRRRFLGARSRPPTLRGGRFQPAADTQYIIVLFFVVTEEASTTGLTPRDHQPHVLAETGMFA